MWICSFPNIIYWRDCPFLHGVRGAPVEDWLTVHLRFYFWALYSVLSTYESIFVQVPNYFDYFSFVTQFEIKKCDTLTFVVLSQNRFGFRGILWLYADFKVVYPISVKNAYIKIFIGIALSMWIALGSMNILTILFQSMNTNYLSTYLCLQFLPSVFHNFHYTDLLFPWENLFLNILFFLMLL